MQIKLDKIKVLRIVLHTLYWLFAWSFFVFYYKRYDEINSYTLVAASMNLIIAMITVYTFNYFLIPRFLLKKKMGQFILYSLLAAILFIYLELLMTLILLVVLLFNEHRLFPQMVDALMLMLNFLFIVLIAVSIKFYKRWTEKENREQTMQKEKIEAELQMLKTQINPHFLFNTLNSIYALALKNSENTAETVMKLSEILDYILYKINTPTIPLSDEIQIIENYIALEKIRFTNRVIIDFKIEVENRDLPIAPMLIIPFVENAFKHGVAKSMDKSWIRIHLKETAEFLEIEIANSTKTQEATEHQGIGIQNTVKRLQLLYNGKANFEKSVAQSTFKIRIQIPKHSNS